MPELPEVETVKNVLIPIVKNRKIIPKTHITLLCNSPHKIKLNLTKLILGKFLFNSKAFL